MELFKKENMNEHILSNVSERNRELAASRDLTLNDMDRFSYDEISSLTSSLQYDSRFKKKIKSINLK